MNLIDTIFLNPINKVDDMEIPAGQNKEYKKAEARSFNKAKEN